MINRRCAMAAVAAGAMTYLTACSAGIPLSSEGRKEINRSGLRVAAGGTVDRLMTSQPETRAIINSAEALLVFPDIIKGGFVLGASGGDGVWFDDIGTRAYYRSSAISYGLQAGITSFGYVMVFLDQESVDFVENSGGWEVGVGPVVTIADDGFAKRFSTSTLKQGIVVFFVNQTGFFAGTGIEGTQITRL